MIDFFSSNLDYCLYFCGVSFILLATLAISLSSMKGNRLQWRWLSAFSYLYALAVWMELFAIGFGDTAAFAIVRTMILAAGFVLLLEFGRSGTAVLSGKAPGRWFVFLFPVLACAGAVHGVEGMNAAVRYVMGVPGALWAASVIWRQGKSREPGGVLLAAAAVLTAACGPAIAASSLPLVFIPASLPADAPALLVSRCLACLAQGGIACAAAMLFWRYNRDEDLPLSSAASRERLIREAVFISLFIIVVVAGWLYVRREGILAESEQRQSLTNLGMTGVAAVDGKRAARLKGSEADLASPDYLRLKEQMTRMKSAARGVRFYYLMRMVGDTAIFLVDSEPAGSEGYFPPGQVYYELAPAHRAVFEKRKAAITGPETDRWGTWVSILAPLDPTDAGTNDVLGIDIEAGTWKHSIAHERADAITIVILISGLLSLFYAVYRRGREEREIIETFADEESLLLNTITTQVWYLSDPETYGLVNDAYAAFYNHSSGAMSHRRLTDVMPKELALPRIENNREVFASRKPTQLETWVHDGRGERRLLHVVKTPKLDARGEVEYLVCSAVDITERELMQAALRVSEAQFRSYFELPLIGIAITSVDKGWIEVNDRLCGIMGRTREELTQMTWSELTHPDDLAADVEQFNRLLAGEIETYSMEKRFIRTDGEVVWTSLAVGCVRNPDRTVDFILALVQDISARKMAEEALRISEERYRLIAENSSDVIWTMTLEGSFLYVSPSITSLTGFTPEEALGIPLDKYILPEYIPLVMTELNRELQKPAAERIQTRTLEIQQYARDGSAIDIEVIATWILNELGEPVGIQGSTRDIRERKKAEAELRDREETLNAITGSARDAIVMIDNDGNVSFWNEAATRILGYEKDEIMGRNLHEMLIPDRYIEKYREKFPGFRSTGKGDVVGTTLELAAIRKDGVEIPVDLSLSAMRLKDRWCAVGIIRDISERKKAESELEKSMEEKAVLLRELQHRVKNSLGMIVGLVDLEANRAASPDVRQALSQVRGRVMSLSNLYDLLYRAEDVRDVRLDQYLRQMCSSLLESYGPGTGRVALEMDLDEVRLQVRAAIPIGLIVNELITNSLKYAFPGGRSGTVSLGLHAAPGVLTLRVADDGAGLPADFGERSKGMGSMLIGMMVRQLKGTYSIEREKGAAFRFTIPL